MAARSCRLAPVNAHCSIEPGQRLEGEMFPMWGELEETEIPDIQITMAPFEAAGFQCLTQAVYSVAKSQRFCKGRDAFFASFIA